MQTNRNNKTVMCVVPGIALALALAAPLSSYADSTNASAKVTIQTSYLNVLGPITNSTAATDINSGWQTVLEQDLKMANNHDLLMVASFEVGLFTSTTVQSKNMVADTSTASELRPLRRRWREPLPVASASLPTHPGACKSFWIPTVCCPKLSGCFRTR